MTIGSVVSTTSASCQLSRNIATIVHDDERALTTKTASPWLMRSCSASTSAVMRDTSNPVRVRSKKPIDMLHDVPEHAGAQIEQERLADLRHAEDRGAAEHVRAERGHDEQHRCQRHRVDVALHARLRRSRS